MQRGIRIIAAFVLVALLLPATLRAEDAAYVQDVEQGQMNWENGLLTATGVGIPPRQAVSAAQAQAMAVRAATVVARRNLLAVLQGVQIDSSTTVKNFMTTSDVVASTVRGYLQNSRVLRTDTQIDGSVEVMVAVVLRDKLASTLLPPSMAYAPPKPATSIPVLSAIESPPAGTNATAPEAPTRIEAALPPGDYTGLIIDAKGLGARPAMSPRILSEDGEEVYGMAFVSREYALSQGMAGYSRDVDTARENPRVAGHPLVLKAKSAAGQSSTDLVVGRADAQRIRLLAERGKSLDECRVMIVLD